MEQIDNGIQADLIHGVIWQKSRRGNLSGNCVEVAALRRPLGDRGAMRAQLEHLVKTAERPNVTLQVAPFSVGGLAAAGGPVTILRFMEPDLPDIVYLEQLTSALYMDKQDDVENYLAVMDRLCAESTTPEQTVEFFKELVAQQA